MNWSFSKLKEMGVPPSAVCNDATFNPPRHEST